MVSDLASSLACKDENLNSIYPAAAKQSRLFRISVKKSPNMTRVNGDRLWEDIMYTSRWGRVEDRPGGMMRLALTAEDRCVREWFRETALELGCSVKVDQMGNMFATFAGENPDVPPIAIGSHLDTQPAGMFQSRWHKELDDILRPKTNRRAIRWDSRRA